MNQVNREDLKPGKLYYIQGLSYKDEEWNFPLEDKKRKNVGVFLELELMGYPSNWFNAVFDWFPVSKFKKITNPAEIENIQKYRVSLSCMFRFYEVKKFDIQNDMEMRAVDLQLRNITGEKFMIW